MFVTQDRDREKVRNDTAGPHCKSAATGALDDAVFDLHNTKERNALP